MCWRKHHAVELETVLSAVGASCNRIRGGWTGTVNRSVATFTGRRVVHTAVTCNVLVTEREQTERLCKTKRAELYRESSSFPTPGGGR